MSELLPQSYSAGPWKCTLPVCYDAQQHRHSHAYLIERIIELRAELSRRPAADESGKSEAAREEGRANGLFEANAIYQMKHPKSAIINGPAMTEVARRGWEIRAALSAPVKTPHQSARGNEGRNQR